MIATPTNSQTGWTIGRVLPRLMLLYFLLDLLLRFVPLDPFTFRAWEALPRHYPDAAGPFVPNKHYHRDASYGAVASIGNLSALRRYHAIDVTTDAHGFHNPPALAQSNPIGIVIGDSFAAGTELPEDETLSAQLSKRVGRYVYNAGSPQPLRLASLQAVAQRLELRRGFVVFEFLEARALQAPPSPTANGAHGTLQTSVFRALGTDWTDRLATPMNQLHASPLEALSAKAEKRIQNDVVLPNSFSRFVIQAKLRNGQPIVFLPAEFQSPADPAKAATAWASYLFWYDSELRRQGLQLIVLLVPNRGTVYAPLLDPPRDVSASAETLSALATALRTSGVSTVSLEPRFAHAAPIFLDRQKYLYFLDDTHWTGEGAAIAAEEIVRALPQAPNADPR